MKTSDCKPSLHTMLSYLILSTPRCHTRLQGFIIFAFFANRLAQCPHILADLSHSVILPACTPHGLHRSRHLPPYFLHEDLRMHALLLPERCCCLWNVGLLSCRCCRTSSSFVQNTVRFVALDLKTVARTWHNKSLTSLKIFNSWEGHPRNCFHTQRIIDPTAVKQYLRTHVSLEVAPHLSSACWPIACRR